MNSRTSAQMGTAFIVLGILGEGKVIWLTMEEINMDYFEVKEIELNQV